MNRSTRLMSSLEIATEPLSKPSTPNRPYSTSVKAIMHSRHANTRRNVKRAPPEPWIGEMIIVKEYDQMDSLRELLDNGARRYTDTVDSVQFDGSEDGVEEEAVLRTTAAGFRGVKRKREEEEDVSNAEEVVPQEAKRMKVAANHKQEGNLFDEKPLPATKCVNKGKENIPPLGDV